MVEKEFIERDSTLLKMWNALYALEDEQEKQTELILCEDQMCKQDLKRDKVWSQTSHPPML